jgi:hypothetical protein
MYIGTQQTVQLRSFHVGMNDGTKRYLKLNKICELARRVDRRRQDTNLTPYSRVLIEKLTGL